MNKGDTTTVSVIWMHEKDFGYIPEASKVGCASFLTSAGEQTTAQFWEGAGVDYLRKIFSIRREWGWHKEFPVYRLSPIEEAFWEYVKEANLLVLGHVCVEQGISSNAFAEAGKMPLPWQECTTNRGSKVVADRMTDPQFAVQLVVRTSRCKDVRHDFFIEPARSWLVGCVYDGCCNDYGFAYQAVGDLTKEADIANIAKFLMNVVQLQIWWYGKLEIVGASFHNYPKLVSIYTGRPLQKWECESVIVGADDYFNY